MTIYQVMPELTEAEYAALKADIAENGVLVPVVKDQHGNVLDGHHRMRIAEHLGIDYRVDIVTVDDVDHARRLARNYNMNRRHLSRKQRRQIIADEINADPNRSNRGIGRLLGVDHKTVASVRRELGGEIPHSSEHVYTEHDLADMLITAICSRHENADTEAEERKWALPVMLCDEIISWATGGANLVWFSKVAATLYALGADDDVWELMAPWLVEIARCSLDECAEVRATRNADDDWRLPGERLAELTITLWGPDLPPRLRPAVYRSLEGPLVLAVAEVGQWWPIPEADAVISGAARVLAHVWREKASAATAE